VADHPVHDDQLEEAGKALKVVRENLQDAGWRARFKNDPKATLESAQITWEKLPDSVRTVVQSLHQKELSFLAQQVALLEAEGLIEDQTTDQGLQARSSFATLCKF